MLHSRGRPSRQSSRMVTKEINQHLRENEALNPVNIEAVRALHPGIGIGPNRSECLLFTQLSRRSSILRGRGPANYSVMFGGAGRVPVGCKKVEA